MPIYMKQLLVDLAQIMTMDAFYNKLIKENFMYLNISPNLTLLMKLNIKLLKIMWLIIN